MPSSSALCASIGPVVTSPTTQMPGTVVRPWPSVSTRPRLSILTPASFAPRPSMKGRRPMQTSSTSVSSVSAAPPAAGSTVTVTPPSPASALVTLVDSWNLMPWRVRIFWNSLADSPSTPGTMRSRNSTTVTSAPSRRHTEPSSSPMIPAPITISRFGTSASDRMPVEDDDRLLVDRDARQRRHFRAGGDDDVLGLQRLGLAVGAGDLDLGRRRRCGRCRNRDRPCSS